MKRISSILILSTLVSLFACRKQQLYFQKVERVESNTESRLNRIMFLDDTTCIISGGDKFLKAEVLVSKDGGKSWMNYDISESGKGLYGMGRSPEGIVYMSGFDGTIVSTRNEGASFESRRIPNWQFHNGLSFINSEKVVLVYTLAQRAGAIVITDTNQQILDTFGYEFGMNDVQMADAQTGYVAGYGAILKTRDGGASWDIQNVENDNFISLDCRSADDVWVCGYNGSIFHTRDGGESWERLRNGNNVTLAKYHLQDIVFKNENEGYAVGEEGVVIYTSDAGKSWNRFSKFTEQGLRAITVCPDGSLLTVGDAGVIYRLHP